VLAICSGALRRYLLELDELPEESLVSMCPISLRDPASKASGGNQVASMTVPLHTEISDPVKRLKAICAETENAKELTRALGARSILEMVNFMPTQLAALGARVAAEQGLANFVTPTVNTVITNVPGPQVPVYSNGAKHLRGWGLGPVTDGNGLFHSVGSYCGELTIGITCCRVMMPDPARYVACLNAAFEELTQALETEEQPLATVKAATKKATPKKATPKKATPKKATPKKAAPKKAAPKKAAPKKAAPKKATFENRNGNKASS
jgi:WS/DGAT/MGAT family acyltransferase